jgi:ribosome recycling factor
MKSDVGIHPSNDGKIIRLQVPPLSQERRQQLAARAKDTAEEARIAMRNVRRDANKQAEALHKEKALSEDELRQLKDEVQGLTKNYEEHIEKLFAAKAHELTTL